MLTYPLCAFNIPSNLHTTSCDFHNSYNHAKRRNRGGKRKQRKIKTIVRPRSTVLNSKHRLRPPSVLTTITASQLTPDKTQSQQTKSTINHNNLIHVQTQHSETNTNNNKREFEFGLLNAQSVCNEKTSVVYDLNHLQKSKTVSVNFTNLIQVDTRNVYTKPSDSLLVGHLNTRSCRNKTFELNDLITEENVDIMFITETWLREKGDEPLMKQIEPENYTFKSFPRKDRDGGGVAAVIRDSYLSKISDIKEDHKKTFQSAKLSLKFENEIVTFVCLYRPPYSKKNRISDREFLDEFTDFLSSFNLENEKTFFIGDFNYHFNKSTSSIMLKIMSILEEHELVQLIDKPTQTSGNILDWVIVRKQDQLVKSACVIEKAISDHSLLLCDLNLSKTTKVKKQVTSRNLKSIDLCTLKKDLAETLTVTESTSSQMTAENFESSCQIVLDNHAPMKTRTIPERSTSSWFSLTEKQAKQEKRHAERRWKKSGLQIHRDIYVYHIKKAKKLCDKTKLEHLNSELRQVKNCKELFQTTNELLGKSKGSVFPTNVHEKELPSLFIDAFNIKVNNIRKQIESTAIDNAAEDLDAPALANGINTFCDFKEATEEDIRKIILESPTKSCELDILPTKLLKECIDEVLPAITVIVNRSLTSGVVPPCFKKAIVKPLLKKPDLDQNDFKNYRPVSNLPFVSKILEKVVLKQLLAHIDMNKMREAFQSAYRPYHCTETALLRVFNDVLAGLDDGNVCLLVLLDLSSAFDTIDHSILLHRLETSFKFSGTALMWFKSYLEDRTQCVKVNNIYSHETLMSYGIPQGSVLGPILFTLYAQPLADIIKHHDLQYHLYADDSQLYKSVPINNMPLAIENIEQCIVNVKTWMVLNKLQLNESKTELIMFGKPIDISKIHSPVLNTNNTAQIMSSTKVKNLGVVFDEHLSMSTYVSSLCKSLYYELRRISMIRKFLTLDVAKTLVISLVLSKLDYGNSLLCGLPMDLLNKLQKVQNHAAKIIFRKKKYDHVSPLLKSLHWLQIQERIDYKIAVLVFKCLSDQAPLYLSDLVNKKVNSRLLRSSSDSTLLTVPRKRLKTYGKRCFEHYGPRLWNSLPREVREKENLSTFKNALKYYLFCKSYN